MGRFQVYTKKADEQVFADFERIAKERAGLAEETAKLVRQYVTEHGAGTGYESIRVQYGGKTYEGLLREVPVDETENVGD